MPLNIDWQQILLHLFNFVILFAVLYYLLYKPVKDFMDKRMEYYKNMEEKASDNLTKSEILKTEYADKLFHAEEEITQKKENARKEQEASLAERKKQTEEEAAKIIADARKTALREREKILKEANSEIADMVTAAAEKIVSGRSTSDAFDSFLADAQKGGNHE